jgi:ABC-type polysaccharide/polyol phosphate export permease
MDDHEMVLKTGVDNSDLTPLWSKRSFYHYPFVMVSDILGSRHLLSLLVKRDIATRYRRAYLGFSWAILEPLLLAGVYSVVFTILVGSSDPLYAAKVIIGVIGWSLFSRSVTSSAKSLTNSVNLFQFARVPKSVFATNGPITNIILALFSLLSLIPFFIIHDLPITINLLIVPFWLFFLSFTGWSIGLLVAPISCKIPDVMNIVNFLVRAGFFLSPVMWTYDMFSRRFGGGWQSIVAHLNPAIVPLTEMRDAVLGTSSGMPSWAYGMCIGMAVIFYLFGSIVFMRSAHKAVVNI